MSEENKEHEVNENLLMLNRIASGNIAYMIEDNFPAIRFTPGGAERFASCIGFVIGVQIKDIKLANTLADSFVNSMRMVSNTEKFKGKYGMMFTESIMLISDDGSPFSMSFSLWHHFHGDEKELANYRRSMKFGYRQSCDNKDLTETYVPSMYGGIILHGFGKTHSVQLCPSIGWSVHT